MKSGIGCSLLFVALRSVRDRSSNYALGVMLLERSGPRAARGVAVSTGGAYASNCIP
jgi:hypothetical protein